MKNHTSRTGHLRSEHHALYHDIDWLRQIKHLAVLLYYIIHVLEDGEIKSLQSALTGVIRHTCPMTAMGACHTPAA